MDYFHVHIPSSIAQALGLAFVLFVIAVFYLSIRLIRSPYKEGNNHTKHTAVISGLVCISVLLTLAHGVVAFTQLDTTGIAGAYMPPSSAAMFLGLAMSFISFCNIFVIFFNLRLSQIILSMSGLTLCFLVVFRSFL